MPQHILDFTDSVGFPFYAYATDQAVSIIRTWAEHPWPITLQEAYTLRDQCGWTGAPDDGRFFTTPVSNGEESGTIMIDTTDHNIVFGIGVRLTTRASLELASRSTIAIQSTYAAYRDILSKVYGPYDKEKNDSGTYVDWTLPSHTSLHLIATVTFVKVRIEAPFETDSMSQAIYYENKYGPTLP